MLSKKGPGCPDVAELQRRPQLIISKAFLGKGRLRERMPIFEHGSRSEYCPHSFSLDAESAEGKVKLLEAASEVDPAGFAIAFAGQVVSQVSQLTEEITHRQYPLTASQSAQHRHPITWHEFRCGTLGRLPCCTTQLQQTNRDDSDRSGDLRYCSSRIPRLLSWAGRRHENAHVR